MRYDTFWTRRYRAILSCARRFSGRDSITLLLLLIALFLTVYGKNLTIVVPVFVAYAFLAIWREWLNVKHRESRYDLQGHIVGGLFNLINRELFSRSNLTRFTLFRLAPFKSDEYLIPWYRFKRGVSDVIKAAGLSMARYKKREGVTGKAWDQPADEFVFQQLPHFVSEEEMRAYFFATLNVPASTAAAISPHMVNVTAIFSYAFLRSNTDLFLGLLSLDIEHAEVGYERQQTLESDGTLNDRVVLRITPNNESEIIVDSGKLHLLLKAVGSVLDTFEERKVHL